MTDETLPTVTGGDNGGEIAKAGDGMKAGDIWASFQKMAKDPDIDPAKMQTLYELQMQIRTDMRQEEFNRSKFAAMDEMPTITKNKAVTNKAGEVMYRYSDFKTLYTAVKPILKKNGLILDFDVNEGKLETKVPMLLVAPILRHTNGYVWQGSYMPVPITAANSSISLTQASKGAVETGKRTVLISCLGITEEEDPSLYEQQGEVPPEMQKVLDAGQRAASGGTQSLNQWVRGLPNTQKGWLITHGHFDALREAARNHD